MQAFSRAVCAAAFCLGCQSAPAPSQVERVLPTQPAPPATPHAEATAGLIAGAVAPASEPSARSPLLLDAGNAAPDVELTLQDGSKRKLSDYVGHNVVLYFYPKDDTPGCTVEAEGFRDHYAELQAAKTIVLGVSTQGAESHRAFIDKYALPFDLVIDADGSLAKAFQVPVTGGISARQSFLIDHGGRVARVWREVTPSGHAEQILAAIRTLRH